MYYTHVKLKNEGLAFNLIGEIIAKYSFFVFTYTLVTI